MKYLKTFSVLTLFIGMTCNPAQAQDQKPPDDRTLQMLVNELRLLRETIQRMNLNEYWKGRDSNVYESGSRG